MGDFLFPEDWVKKERKTINCPSCSKEIHPKGTFIGVCFECEREGYWMDPAGGLHSDNEDDPAKMYE